MVFPKSLISMNSGSEKHRRKDERYELRVTWKLLKNSTPLNQQKSMLKGHLDPLERMRLRNEQHATQVCFPLPEKDASSTPNHPTGLMGFRSRVLGWHSPASMPSFFLSILKTPAGGEGDKRVPDIRGEHVWGGRGWRANP